MSHRWLVSSGGRRGALVRILQRVPAGSENWVMVTDASRLSSAGLLADEFQIVPRIGHENFISEMRGLCRNRGIQTVVPTIDTELSMYSECREDFAAVGSDVLVSSPEVVRLSMDKWKLHRWLVSSGFPTVETYESKAFDPSLLEGPVVAKPRGGSSSIGVLFAEHASELHLSALTDDYIVQRVADGFELTIDFAVARDGSLLGAVPRRRLETRAGEVSKGVTVRAVWLDDFVRDLVSALPGAYGILNVQVFVDPPRRSLAVIELNARVGGGFPLSFQAGGDFFTPLAQKANAELTNWTEGVVMLRYDDAVFFHSDKYGLQQA